MALLDIMAPSTRNSKVCDSCGVLIVRVGKGEEDNSGVGLVQAGVFKHN